MKLRLNRETLRSVPGGVWHRGTARCHETWQGCDSVLTNCVLPTYPGDCDTIQTQNYSCNCGYSGGCGGGGNTVDDTCLCIPTAVDC